MTAEQFLAPDAQQTDHEAWLDARRTGVGGSDIVAILGLSRWASAWTVWQSKSHGGDSDENDYTLWGHIVEPALKAWLTRKTGVTVEEAGTWRRIDEPWMICNPDGFTSDGGGVECKHHGSRMGDEWTGGQVSDAAELQAQWCMAVTGRPHWWVVAKVGDAPPLIARVEADPHLQSMLVERAREFWFDFVVAGVEPDPTHVDVDRVKAAHPEAAPAAIAPRDEEEADRWVKELAEARALKADAKKREDAAMAWLGNTLGDADHLLIDGKVALTWKSSPTRRLSEQAMRAAGLDPDDYKPETTQRTMRVPAKRNDYKEAS